MQILKHFIVCNTFHYNCITNLAAVDSLALGSLLYLCAVINDVHVTKLKRAKRRTEWRVVLSIFFSIICLANILICIFEINHNTYSVVFREKVNFQH
jgi:hypothetical protein